MMKSTINRVMIKLTGYRFQKAPDPNAVKKLSLPRHYDDEAKAIIRRVKPRTLTGIEKIFGLIEATRYVVDNGIEGDVVECGVWRGGSMQTVALVLKSLGVSDRDIHLFDTFEGMPPPGEQDLRYDGQSAQSLLDSGTRDQSIWAYATLDDVKEGLREVDYPAERVHFHRGMVEETIPSQAPEKISILRLDTDWYASTIHELEQLYDRLTPGGVLIIDDYGFWKGSRQATDEFIARRGLRLFLVPLLSGRIAIKPL